MFINGLLVLLPFLFSASANAAPPSPSSVVIDRRALSNVRVDFNLPKYTTFTLDQAIDETYPDMIRSYGFNPAEAKDKDIVDSKWLQQKFTWHIYDDEKSAKDENQKEKLWKMDCLVQLSKDTDKAVHTFDVTDTAPYIKLTGGDNWDQIKNQANVICPSGSKCLKEGGCGDKKKPQWDQKFLNDHKA
ncbi:uncharacterized protein I303_105889 [Kwoniella dejecticola CBS 10117]|uniref:Secreted protein n=1 Tax=Kwoniella dejecticola CBS 10117 TaxID=1296121 RepID=A0A1A6A0R1_9TREE|nr:uncharacterized protein I303_05911 [Kwoniella dejecticola CBS 10117]OBR83631.1 hypothetical protein I303_05911 [Kwoniella dejecticola CBS 10117]